MPVQPLIEIHIKTESSGDLQIGVVCSIQKSFYVHFLIFYFMNF